MANQHVLNGTGVHAPAPGLVQLAWQRLHHMGMRAWTRVVPRASIGKMYTNPVLRAKGTTVDMVCQGTDSNRLTLSSEDGRLAPANAAAFVLGALKHGRVLQHVRQDKEPAHDATSDRQGTRDDWNMRLLAFE